VAKQTPSWRRWAKAPQTAHSPDGRASAGNLPPTLQLYVTEYVLSELIGLTLIRVSLSPTLFRQSTGYSAIEGLWGTLDRLTDRLRGAAVVRADGGGAGPLYPSATLQLPNPQGLGRRKRGVV
jgi:hypothetical protein